jgi:hypothetical protein
MNKSLPAILADAADIAARLAEADGELTAEMDALIEFNAQELAAKADRYHYVLMALNSQAEMSAQKASDWMKVSEASERAALNLKARLLSTMQAADMVELIGNETTWRIQANKPSVIITDKEKIPAMFTTLETPQPVMKYDKAAIYDYLKRNQTVPGAHLETSYRVVPRVSKKLVGK